MEYYHDTRLIRKVTRDYEKERTKRLSSGISMSFKDLPDVVVQEVRHWLRFDERLGIPD